MLLIEPTHPHAMTVDRPVFESLSAHSDAVVEHGSDGEYVTTGGRFYRQALPPPDKRADDFG